MDLGEKLMALAESYRSQGYDVAVRPDPDRLPPFARNFRVEIVGRRGAGGVLVAVRKNRDAVAADGELGRYAEVTGAQPGWRFDLAVLEGEEPGARDRDGAHEFSEAEIAESLNQADELSRIGFTRLAVVAAWAALEAAMRMRLRASGQEAGWGSVPRQMVRELYSAGALSPDEFRRVDAAVRLRNQVVHGYAPVGGAGEPEPAVVGLLADVTRRLVAESQPAEQLA
jgi:uncharacterized protein YutE (UPF0331/DUF86 family)